MKAKSIEEWTKKPRRRGPAAKLVTPYNYGEFIQVYAYRSGFGMDARIELSELYAFRGGWRLCVAEFLKKMRKGLRQAVNAR